MAVRLRGGRHLGRLVAMGVLTVGVGVGRRAGGEHRPDGEESDERGRHREPTLALTVGRQDRADVGGDRCDHGECGTCGVGEARLLTDLQSVDPRDSREASGEPAGEGAHADGEDRPRRATAGAEHGPDAHADLEDGGDHEDAGELPALHVDAGSSGVHRPGGDRHQTGEHDDRHAPTHRRGRHLGIIRLVVNRHVTRLGA